MNFSSYNCNFSFLPVKIKKSGEYLLEDYKILKRRYPNVILLETPTFSPRHYFDKNGNRFDDNTIISVISRKENNIEFFLKIIEKNIFSFMKYLKHQWCMTQIHFNLLNIILLDILNILTFFKLSLYL